MVGISLSIPDIAALQNGVSLAAPAAPTLTLISGAGDNQPDFTVSAAAADLPVGATVTIFAFTDAGLTALEDTGSGSVAITGTATITDQLGPLTDGSKFYVARTSIAGHATSANSNTQTNTIDATAPTLSSPTGTKTGSTTADLSVSTNEGNGTLYAVVVASGDTAPTAAQIIAGHNAADGAAVYAANQAVVSTGVKTFSATGLSGSTSYKAYYAQQDAVGNRSAVSGSSAFTTDSASVPTTWDPAKLYGIVLTGSNLIASYAFPPFDNEAVESVSSVASTDKKYVEFLINNDAGSISLGFADATFVLTNAGSLLNAANAFGYREDGLAGYNGANVASSAYTTGNVVSLTIDGPNRKVGVRINNGNWNNTPGDDPATNTGGYSISGINFPLFVIFRTQSNGDSVTVRFSSASWTVGAPSGFTPIT